MPFGFLVSFVHVIRRSGSIRLADLTSAVCIVIVNIVTGVVAVSAQKYKN